MGDIFLSYEKSDRDHARRLAEALQARGWSVWWDRKIPPGRTFEEVISEAIDTANCVVVLWSATSVKSNWVRDEAQEGDSRGILVPVTFDGHKPPMGFRQLQAADLSQWQGDDQHEGFVSLCAEIGNRLPPDDEAGHQAAPIKLKPESPPKTGLSTTPQAQEPRDSKTGANHLVTALIILALLIVAAVVVFLALPAERRDKLVAVDGGCFKMGSPASEYDEERPVHGVCLGDYLIGRHAVSFAEYDEYARETGKKLPNDSGWGRADRPVINVSWQDAKDYASWFGKKMHLQCDLPTEAEWEYAARAGTTTPYSWGDEIGQNRANCDGCGSQWDNSQTSPVGSFTANDWGLHDVHGNVWEWVEDCLHSNYLDAPEDGSAWLEADGGNCDYRVMRGGSLASSPELLRSALRRWSFPDKRRNNLGFRVVCGPY